jgi:hypothetical protein
MKFSVDLHEGTGMSYFRCYLCRRPISPSDLDKHHGCAHCGHTRVSPTSLTWFEKVVEVCRHPGILKLLWQDE